MSWWNWKPTRNQVKTKKQPTTPIRTTNQQTKLHNGSLKMEVKQSVDKDPGILNWKRVRSKTDGNQYNTSHTPKTKKPTKPKFSRTTQSVHLKRLFISFLSIECFMFNAAISLLKLHLGSHLLVDVVVGQLETVNTELFDSVGLLSLGWLDGGCGSWWCWFVCGLFVVW